MAHPDQSAMSLICMLVQSNAQTIMVKSSHDIGTTVVSGAHACGQTSLTLEPSDSPAAIVLLSTHVF